MRLRWVCEGARRRACAISLVVFLAGCASIPSIADPPLAGARTFEGRISVRYKDLVSGKEDALSGRFVWTQYLSTNALHETQTGDDIELTLLDPLGQTVALILSDAHHSSITFRDGRKVEGATPEALTQDTLGWTVPLSGLASWLEGQPAAHRPFDKLDDGRLRQDNWTIRFVRDDDKGNATGRLPPKRIDLSYPGPPAEIEMRLAIDQRSGG